MYYVVNNRGLLLGSIHYVCREMVGSCFSTLSKKTNIHSKFQGSQSYIRKEKYSPATTTPM